MRPKSRWVTAVVMWAVCAGVQAQLPRALTEGMRLSNQICKRA